MSEGLSTYAIDANVKLSAVEGLLATASVIIDGKIEIHGWRICPSTHFNENLQEKIWIQPPSTRAGSSWRNTVFISDKALYNKIEERIYDAFNLKRNQTEGYRKEPISSSQIAEDIPF